MAPNLGGMPMTSKGSSHVSMEPGPDSLTKRRGNGQGSSAATAGQQGAASKFQVLETFRFVAAIQIVGFHMFTSTPSAWVNRFNRWGNGPLSFFWILSGFVLACRYGKKDARGIDLWDFMIKRWAQLYPLYLASIVAGYWIMPWAHPQPLGLLVVLALCLSGYVPSAFINRVNTPGWTVGSFFVLYLIFPYSLRMIQSASPRVRVLVLMPLFYLFSTAKVLLDLGYSMGIFTPVLRVAAIASVPNFWAGINLGVLFLEHEWGRHPMLLQRLGLTLPLIVLILLPCTINADHDLNIFFRTWRSHGLLGPLYMCLIWYGARGKDVLNGFLAWGPLIYLGSISYAIYLLQQFVVDYMWSNNRFLQHRSYPPPLFYFAYLIGLSALATHAVQNPYMPYLINWANRLRRPSAAPPLSPTTKKLGTSSSSGAAAAGSTPSQGKDGQRCRCLSWGKRVGVLSWWREVVAAAFAVSYVLYVNWQPCAKVTCAMTQEGISYTMPRLLSTKQWPDAEDWGWFLNWYSIPCDPRWVLAKPLLTAIEGTTIFLTGIGLLLLSAWGVYRSKQRTSTKQGGGRTSTTDSSSSSPLLPAVVLIAVDTPGVSSSSSSQHFKQVKDLASQVVSSCVGGSVGTVGAERLRTSSSTSSSPAAGGSGAVGIYLGPDTRLTPEQVQWLALHAPADGTLAIYSTQVDGSDDVVPSFWSLCDLAAVHHPGTQANDQQGEGGQQQHGEDDGHSMGPAVLVARVGSVPGLTPSVVSSAVHTGILPSGASNLPVSARGVMGQHTTASLSTLVDRRTAWTRRKWEDHGLAGLCLSSSLSLCHLCFSLAALALACSPVHTHYSKGFYNKFACGYDCAGGVGSGLRANRILMAIGAAIYTAVVLRSFLVVARPSSGGWVRWWFLLFLLLFALPLAALTEAVVTMGCCLDIVRSALGLPHLRLPRPLLYGRKGSHGGKGTGRSAMGDHDDDDDSMLEDETQALLTSRPPSTSSSSQQPWTREAADRRAGQGAASAHTAVRFAAL